jgi:hypothetical protein
MCHLFWWDSLIISPTELQYIVLTLIGKVFCRKTFEINLFRHSIQEAFLHYEPSRHSQCVYILVMLDGMGIVMPLIHEIHNPHRVYSFSNLNKLFCLTAIESRTETCRWPGQANNLAPFKPFIYHFNSSTFSDLF